MPYDGVDAQYSSGTLWANTRLPHTKYVIVNSVRVFDWTTVIACEAQLVASELQNPKPLIYYFAMMCITHCTGINGNMTCKRIQYKLNFSYIWFVQLHFPFEQKYIFDMSWFCQQVDREMTLTHIFVRLHCLFKTTTSCCRFARDHIKHSQLSASCALNMWPLLQ